MIKSIALAAAAVAALLTTAAPAQAYRARQGISFNGFYLNGLQLNGLSANGRNLQGVSSIGAATAARPVVTFAVTSVTLAGGKAVAINAPSFKACNSDGSCSSPNGTSTNGIAAAPTVAMPASIGDLLNNAN